MVKSLTLNPYMSLCNLKLCTHIWSTNINFGPSPLTLDFLVCLSLTIHPMGELESVGPATIFLSRRTLGQKRDYLSRASQRARGATKTQKRIMGRRPRRDVRCHWQQHSQALKLLAVFLHRCRHYRLFKHKHIV